jgi:thymidylate synthase (FAD)
MISATLLAHMGNDLDVVNAAKVSFAKESKEFDDNSVRLIKYLAKHRHMSPFGHCFARFHVKAPIFVARQLVKHKFLRWNEVSRRYVDDEPEFYKPDVWRGRSADKKQGSDGVVKLYGVAEQIVDDYVAEALTAYQVLLEAGVAPEQARMVLPQSTMTEWWWSGSLDAFADMCRLRITPDTVSFRGSWVVTLSYY